MIVIFVKASGTIPASGFFQQPLQYAVNSLFLQKIRKSGYYGNNKSNISHYYLISTYMCIYSLIYFPLYYLSIGNDANTKVILG